MRILITGFTPMGTWKQNSSELLLRSLIENPLVVPDVEILLRLIPAQSFELSRLLSDLITSSQPDACLFLGQAKARNKLTLERFALNMIDFTHPDADGCTRTAEPIVPDGPPAYRSTFPELDAAVAALQAAGIPAAASNHGGTSLCNQLLYLALHQAAESAVPICAGFLHVPVMPEQVAEEWPDAAWMPLETMREGLRIILAHT
ncbi:MAG: hypothetical protein KDD69_14325 [Bdellovibrionales bacterium]|nr:hypothetical protein [Bdellovibrionales bacterium]